MNKQPKGQEELIWERNFIHRKCQCLCMKMLVSRICTRFIIILYVCTAPPLTKTQHIASQFKNASSPVVVDVVYNMETFKAVLVFLILCAVLFVEDSFQKKSCKVVPLKARTSIKAKIIFSGTVISIIKDGKYSSQRHIFGSKKHHHGKNIFAAKVVIKRVFRGPLALKNRMVIVENLGNPRICMANPQVNIFHKQFIFLKKKIYLSIFLLHTIYFL